MNDETDNTPASGLSTQQMTPDAETDQEDTAESADQEDFGDDPTTDLTADYAAAGDTAGDVSDAGYAQDARSDAPIADGDVLDADDDDVPTADDDVLVDADGDVPAVDGDVPAVDGDVLVDADGDVPGTGDEYAPDTRADIVDAGQNAPDAREYPSAVADGSAADSASHGGLLEGAELQNMIMRWKDIQSEFVDEPGRAVEEADALVGELMQQLSAMFVSERAELEQRWAGNDRVSTEELRQGLRRYRVFFERLLAA
jgi:hypothetical protein